VAVSGREKPAKCGWDGGLVGGTTIDNLSVLYVEAGNDLEADVD